MPKFKVTSIPVYGRFRTTSGALTLGEVVTTADTTPDFDGDLYVQRANGGLHYVRKTCLTPVDESPTVSDFPVGTRVHVPADAKTAGGGGVYFGKAVDGEVIPGSNSRSVHVRTEDAGAATRVQLVGPQYLTKITEPTPEAAPVDKIAVAALRKAAEVIGARDFDKFLDVARAIEAGI